MNFCKNLELIKRVMMESFGKGRANALAEAIISGIELDPRYYDGVEQKELITTLYRLTDADQFLKFCNSIVKNYPANAKETIALTSFLHMNDGLKSDGGVKMFNNAAFILREYLKRNYPVELADFHLRG